MTRTAHCDCCDRDFPIDDTHWFRIEEERDGRRVCIGCISEAVSIYVARRIVELHALHGFIAEWEKQYKPFASATKKRDNHADFR